MYIQHVRKCKIFYGENFSLDLGYTGNFGEKLVSEKMNPKLAKRIKIKQQQKSSFISFSHSLIISDEYGEMWVPFCYYF